jgi:hypothetical protein
MSSSTPVPQKDIVFTDFDGGEGMIVDLTTKQYYRLNETAALIWRSLESGKAVDDIVADLHSSYEVSLEQAAASVERILVKLESNKLVKVN